MSSDPCRILLKPLRHVLENLEGLFEFFILDQDLRKEIVKSLFIGIRFYRFDERDHGFFFLPFLVQFIRQKEGIGAVNLLRFRFRPISVTPFLAEVLFYLSRQAGERGRNNG